MSEPLRILIVCEHASARFGGEAALPLHYFRVLRRRGYDVWLITHARTRSELQELFPSEKRIWYIEDSLLHRLLWRLSGRIPARIAYFTTGFVMRISTQLAARRLVRRLVATERIDVIHQPMPVSPSEPSMMFGFGTAVIIGPMNGGMDYPPGFRGHHGNAERLMVSLGRRYAAGLNWLIPGKRHATFLLVANSRTREALPSGVSPRVVELVENGVDTGLWSRQAGQGDQKESPVSTFIFLGRLVDWKAIDLLLHAFRRAVDRAPMRLLVVGDGPERPRLESLAARLGISAHARNEVGRVFFAGWQPQQVCAEELRNADCLVLPSLMECGGAVVLEAMCVGKPVIATAWGGPADYLDDSCGLLVPPTSPEGLIQGFADGMVRISCSPEARTRMGASGRAKALSQYDWEKKVDRVLELYRQARDFVTTSKPGLPVR